MKNIALDSSPEFYLNYIKLTEDKPLLDILAEGGISGYVNNIDKLIALKDNVYAEGKWTVKAMIQHCIDTERIFINRALRFVRNDKTDLPGYEHNDYVDVAQVDHRDVHDLIEEYKAVRKASYYFFKSLSEEELCRKGKANGLEIAVVSIGYILVGHPTHHFNILKERYFTLLD